VHESRVKERDRSLRYKINQQYSVLKISKTLNTLTTLFCHPGVHTVLS